MKLFTRPLKRQLIRGRLAQLSNQDDRAVLDTQRRLLGLQADG